MIWYHLPVTLGSIVFLVLLVTTVFQALISLVLGELLHEKSMLSFIRLLYGSLAAISAVLSLEALQAMASVEGGVFLAIPSLYRYASVLPALVFLFSGKNFAKLPPRLKPPLLTIFTPLLRLPPVDWLPMPLPVLFAVFAAVWLMFDAVLMLLSLSAYTREEITPAAMLHIVRGMDHGICVANRRGWVLEANPAFYNACERLGVSKFEYLSEFEQALKTLHGSGLLKINDLEDGRFIHTRNFVYFLQQNSFKTGKKTFIQTALSDVTKAVHAVLKLEKENERLAQNNKELEAVISEIELEETMNERQRLCRAAHDFWSQRLAVAGLSIDILLNLKNRQPDQDTLGEIKEALKIPVEIKTGPAFCDLDDTLKELTAMYRRLGVKIQVNGGADFTGQEQEILCAVFREALANAVRHAYARQVFVNFYEDRASAGVAIRNRCLDDSTDLVEGRGLYDIRALVNSAGGAVQYQKNGSFVLKVTFLKQERAERILKEGQA